MIRKKIHYLKKPRGKGPQIRASRISSQILVISEVICIILTKSFLSRTKALPEIRKNPHRQTKFQVNTYMYLKFTH